MKENMINKLRRLSNAFETEKDFVKKENERSEIIRSNAIIRYNQIKFLKEEKERKLKNKGDKNG